MKTRPVIGIILDHAPEKKQTGGSFTISKNYIDAIQRENAIILSIIPLTKSIDFFLGQMDGLLLTGGGLDMPPESYGSLRHHQTLICDTKRSDFELNLVSQFLETGKPILAIGAGQELLTVALGGTLIQDIPSEIENAIMHVQKAPLHKPCHKVSIREKTLLHRIVKTDSLDVNSAHHQATKDIPEDVIINATAPDGVIEGIEWPEHPFCLGVVWHPEYHISPADQAIFKAFIKATR